MNKKAKRVLEIAREIVETPSNDTKLTGSIKYGHGENGNGWYVETFSPDEGIDAIFFHSLDDAEDQLNIWRKERAKYPESFT